MKAREAKEHLAAMLADLTAGSVLHLLGEVFTEAAEADPGGQVDRGADALRDAVGTLFVVGVGLDAVWPGRRR